MAEEHEREEARRGQQASDQDRYEAHQRVTNCEIRLRRVERDHRDCLHRQTTAPVDPDQPGFPVGANVDSVQIDCPRLEAEQWEQRRQRR